MQQSFQRAVSTYRKCKGQDCERLKRDRFMLTVPTRNVVFIIKLILSYLPVYLTLALPQIIPDKYP